jgi:hypothetical protein
MPVIRNVFATKAADTSKKIGAHRLGARASRREHPSCHYSAMCLRENDVPNRRPVGNGRLDHQYQDIAAAGPICGTPSPCIGPAWHRSPAHYVATRPAVDHPERMAEAWTISPRDRGGGGVRGSRCCRQDRTEFGRLIYLRQVAAAGRNGIVQCRRVSAAGRRATERMAGTESQATHVVFAGTGRAPCRAKGTERSHKVGRDELERAEACLAVAKASESGQLEPDCLALNHHLPQRFTSPMGEVGLRSNPGEGLMPIERS